MKVITLNAGAALERLTTLTADKMRRGLYLHRAEAGEQVFYVDIEESLLSVPGERPVRLVFYTAAELARDAVGDAVQLTTRWSRRLPALADALYAGQESADTLLQIGEALVWLQQVCTRLAEQGLDVAAWPARLHTLTGELAGVMEGADAAARADFLLYELHPALDELLDRLVGLVIPEEGSP